MWIIASVNIFLAYTLGKDHFTYIYLLFRSLRLIAATNYSLLCFIIVAFLSVSHLIALSSLMIFFFELFPDGIDGKQARRTKTSSPLGELFDHGVDSYSAAMIPIFFFAMFGTRAISPYRMYFVMWNVFLNFYLTHFEKYNTGVLYLPWAYDVTMWVSAMIFL